MNREHRQKEEVQTAKLQTTNCWSSLLVITDSTLRCGVDGNPRDSFADWPRRGAGPMPAAATMTALLSTVLGSLSVSVSHSSLLVLTFHFGW